MIRRPHHSLNIVCQRRISFKVNNTFFFSLHSLIFMAFNWTVYDLLWIHSHNNVCFFFKSHNLFFFLSIWIERNSDCRNELHLLHNKLKNQYVMLNANSDSNAAMKRASLIPNSIKGTLIAHLHEHKSAVTKLTALSSSSSLFASASTDGTVRLFDCNKLNGHQSINK